MQINEIGKEKDATYNHFDQGKRLIINEIKPLQLHYH